MRHIWCHRLKNKLIVLMAFVLAFSLYSGNVTAEPSSSAAASSSAAPSSSADSSGSKSAQQRKKEAEESKAAEEEKKRETEKQKEETEKQKKETEEHLSQVNQRAIDLNVEAVSVQEKFENKRQEVSDTADELKAAQDQVKQQYESMKKRFKLIYEKGTTGYVEIILESKSIAEMINRTQYVSAALESDKALLENFKNKVETINNLKTKLEQDEADLRNLSIEAKNKLQQAKNSIEEAKATIRQQEETIRKQEESIENSAQRIKELEKEIIIADKEIGTTGGKQGAQTTQTQVTKGESVSVEASDRDMIAAMVWCEVGAEGMEEKKGVASVIVNRLKSSHYPDTVQAVLYQNRQFQPTWSKTSDGSTTKFLLALANGAPSDCYSAADWALAGNSNVGEAIGFKLASTGIEGIVIGKVVFFS